MIQRVQSILLLIVALLSILLIYLPVYERIPVNSDAMATSVGISKSAILEILNGTIGVIAFLTIFLFKNRRLQLRLNSLAILLTCIFIALLFFMVDTMSSDEIRIHYVAGSYLPLIQLLFIFLASRFIRKDEELVRSADRLR